MNDESDVSFDISVDAPLLVVEVEMPGDFTIELEYDLKDVFNFDGEDVEVIDSHWHGIVLDTPDGTEHIDFRELDLDKEGVGS